ncbi:uncharacterized protein FA14DRAFT_176903 [Meira miltonrushii]|uniref:Uncharacterized protein n=1 Tax=Meira miltonrushii TaxID=1280837 RepID=A0A316VK58_9BASI|nr:uncharacterized protein FA14DRAFT_176903 [Meira miltonrushii]PWN37614.1 hypothetical protein FA14DRAFT_176903 [Meira miltonrushii]
MKKAIFAIIVLLLVQNVFETAVAGSSDSPVQFTPSHSNEATNQSTPEKRPNNYQKRKDSKIAKLEKLGVETNVAKTMVMKYLSGYHSKWTKKNKEKELTVKRESYHRRYNIIKDKANERRKERYHERKATEPNFLQSRRKTTQDRFEATVRSNLKKGMTQTQAKEEAGKYIDTYRMKSRQSLRQRRLEKKQKEAQHDDHTSVNVSRT